MSAMSATSVPPAGAVTDAWLVVPLYQEAAVIGDVVVPMNLITTLGPVAATPAAPAPADPAA